MAEADAQELSAEAAVLEMDGDDLAEMAAEADPDQAEAAMWAVLEMLAAALREGGQ